MNAMDEIRERARAQLKVNMRYAHENNIKLHPHRCGRCKYQGTFHEAVFAGMVNIVTPDCIVAMLWVNFNGCKSYKYMGKPTTEATPETSSDKLRVEGEVKKCPKCGSRMKRHSDDKVDWMECEACPKIEPIEDAVVTHPQTTRRVI